MSGRPHGQTPARLVDIQTNADTRPPLRFLTCGSAGNGKSTLIGCLLDGLETGREQGAGVVYRSFATPRRAFVVADAPGDEQEIRGMTVGARDAVVAVLLVDARNGLLSQTRRHAIIARLFGIRHVVLAVNKLDLVAFDRAVFERICESFGGFSAELGFKEITCIPISARYGDNVSALSARTPWHAGPSLLEYLETVDGAHERAGKPFRMAVQSVDAAGFAGTIASGSLKRGDEIAVLPSGWIATVKSLAGAGGECDSARAGEAVTVTLAGETAVASGDVLAASRDRPQVADQFAAHLVWLSGDQLLPERSYLMKINHRILPATVTALKHRIDVDSFAKLAAKTLGLNEIGVCNVALAQPVAFDPYADNRDTGAFILLDRYTNQTVAAGTIDFALRRATNIHHQNITVSKAERAAAMRHRPAVLWFTGLPGAGKSTIANLVEARLHAHGAHTALLDGDNIRHGLNRDLGFTAADRVENIRRIGEVAKLMTDAGLIVLCSFISPFRAERRMVRELLEQDEFVEIFVDTPLDICIARDPKGLYARALAGEIKNFTGVDQVYEAPERAEIRLDAGHQDADQLAQKVVEELARRGICR